MNKSKGINIDGKEITYTGERVSCSYDKLTSIILNQNVIYFDCYDNQLTSLVLTKNVEYLYCDKNQLTSLVLTENVKTVYSPEYCVQSW